LPARDLALLTEAAREAGRIALRFWRRDHKVWDKGGEHGPVTEADLAVNDMLKARLLAARPGYGWLSEETPDSADRLAVDTVFIVDPIDGTTNYASGVPWWAVNVALYQAEEALLAVTLHLPYGELFWAEAGGGAWRTWADGRTEQIRVSSAETLGAGLVGTGFPTHRGLNEDNNYREFVRISPFCRDVRRMGSAAIDLAHVAAGIYSSFWEGFLNPWDVGPGLLLVREAGGHVTDYAGAPYAFGATGLVASNGQPGVHGVLLENIQAARMA